MQIEAKSDTPLLNEMIVGNNAESGRVYNPKENTLYITDYSLKNSQFGNQPELRAMLEFGDAIKSRGFSNTQATNSGAKEVKGHQTYKVETTYPAGGNSQVNLEDVNVTFWIDQETSRPHKVEVSVERGGISGRGSITVQGDLNITADIAQDVFYYIPTGEGVQTVDLSNDLPRPDSAPPVPAELNLE